MLSLISAVRFDDRVSSGRTRPSRVACAPDNGAELIEVILKVSRGCEELRVGGLVAEAIAAMLAADLKLPVPEPFLVRLSDEFIAAVPDKEIAQLMQESVRVGYGSRKLPPGYMTWPRGSKLPQALARTAVEVIAFYAFIHNPDRKPGNPNCLIKGDQICIYDHELAFSGRLAIGSRAPWEDGSLDWLRKPESHLFADALRRKPLQLGGLKNAWSRVSDERLDEYRRALPREWDVERLTVKSAMEVIRGVRQNFDQCIAQLTKALG